MYAQFYIFRAGSVCSIKVVAPKVIFFFPRRSPVPVRGVLWTLINFYLLFCRICICPPCFFFSYFFCLIKKMQSLYVCSQVFSSYKLTNFRYLSKFVLFKKKLLWLNSFAKFKLIQEPGNKPGQKRAPESNA